MLQRKTVDDLRELNKRARDVIATIAMFDTIPDNTESEKRKKLVEARDVFVIVVDHLRQLGEWFELLADELDALAVDDDRGFDA